MNTFSFENFSRLEYETKDIKIGKDLIRTYQFGQGDNIILAFPGFPFSGLIFSWLLMNSDLRNSRVVTFDMPGWAGFSKIDPNITYTSIERMVEIGNSLMESEFPKKSFSILGYSYGGALGVKIFGINKQKVKRIALVSPVIDGKTVYTSWVRLIELAKKFHLNWFVRKYVQHEYIDPVLRYLEENFEVPLSYMQLIDDALSRIDNKVLLDSLNELFHIDLRVELSLINEKKVPIMVINSKDEEKIFRKQAEFIRRILDHEKSVFLHGRHEDFALKPNSKVIDSIVKFLSS